LFVFKDILRAAMFLPFYDSGRSHAKQKPKEWDGTESARFSSISEVEFEGETISTQMLGARVRATGSWSTSARPDASQATSIAG
jgi:hypothetical protein